MSACLRRVALAGVGCLFTMPVLGHPGHGKDGGSHEMSHYLSEPEHLAPLAIAGLVGAVAAGVVVWYRRRA